MMLVLAAIVIVSLVNLAIAFRGPPPRPAPWQVGEVAAALDGRTPRGEAGEVLTVGRVAAPAPRRGEVRDAGAEALLATGLGRRPGDIRLFAGGAPHRPPPGELPGRFTAAVRDGAGWRTISTAPAPLLSRWQATTIGGMLLAALVLSVAGWWLARAISRPIVDLARSAEAAGPHDPRLPVPAGAPREVATLAAAFSALGERLGRHLANRTATLAAIAHDLGTPLSRLAFHVERLPDDERRRAEADIAEMRAMLAAVLGFARETGGRDAHRPLDLGSLIDSFVEDGVAAGEPLTLVPGERLVVSGDPAALRRAVANLAGNAVRYGGGAEIGWRRDGTEALVFVADRGPGFGAIDAERLFEPFVRGEPSRNRDTGGAGLGLAIVRGVAEAHGGSAAITPRAGGGTIATIRLPIATSGNMRETC